MLDDNTRGALHYLLLGVLIVGGLRLLVGLADLTLNESGPLAAFRNGYLLVPEGGVVLADEGPMARVMRGLLAACALATAAVLLLRPALGSWPRAYRAGRWSLGLAVLWVFVCGYLVPARSAWPDRESSTWTIRERSRIWMDLWVPGPTVSRHLPLADTPLHAAAMALPGGSCSVHLQLHETAGWTSIGSLSPTACDDPKALALAEAALDALRASARP